MSQHITEEQLGIIRHMLLKSPPGELHLVLKEIKDILEGVVIPEAFLESVLKEYNITYHTLVDVPENTRPVVLVGSLDDESNEYDDVMNQRRYQFNHLENQIVQQTPFVDKPSAFEPCEQLRQSLIPAVKRYLNERFCKKSAASLSCDGNHIDLFIVGETVKLSSYYTGRWVGHYSLDSLHSDIHVTGDVSIQSHYYENGNVQMTVHRELSPITLAFSEKAADEVIQAIGSFEDSLQTSLKEVFSSLQKDALKDFRRQLPRTRQHFQWNVNAHKMANTMREVKQMEKD